MPMLHNVGEVDGNVRKFLALPLLVLTVVAGLVYHAYALAAATFLMATGIFASGVLHFSTTWWILGIDSRGGLHRARTSR